MKIREYSGPLTVFAAGVLGFSLICIVSAAALANPGTSDVSDLGARDIVNSAFSNPISTAAAMTAVEIATYLPTPTPSVTESVTPSPTEITYITPTRPFITWTPIPPTRTRGSRPGATLTPTQQPTRTPSKTPTKTQVPSPTDTSVPTFTDTPVPPTDTPVPPPTDTPVPPPTDTPVPPPTDTPPSVPQDLTAAP